MAVARHLVRPTRGSPLPALAVRAGPRRLFGLAPTGGCRAAPVTRKRGGLLPHRFTLAGHRPAVCSLWPCPSPRGAQALPGSLPLELGLSSGPKARDRHTPRPEGSRRRHRRPPSVMPTPAAVRPAWRRR